MLKLDLLRGRPYVDLRSQALLSGHWGFKLDWLLLLPAFVLSQILRSSKGGVPSWKLILAA
jgi:hypothetical protein